MSSMAGNQNQKIMGIKQLIANCHFYDALYNVSFLELRENLPSNIRLTCTLFRGVILNKLGEWVESLHLTDSILKELNRSGSVLQVIDALLIKIEALSQLDRHVEALSTIEQVEHKLTKIAQA